ncbi:Cytochrome B561 [hydrothermal vent metagenome]|uniref:Cytochrome B561 n=1 Tax=hydrothermal vent metagenome TaxID=652676 RepID=A0A3B0XHK9_9ZZZZ
MNTMRFKNSNLYYGWVSIVLHWFMAIALIGLYFLGDYMVDLDYYDAWYHKGPALHKSAGILLAAVLVFRFIWNYSQTRPKPQAASISLYLLARVAHLMLYLITALLIISGYLISTAKGQGIEVFNFFELPAILSDSSERGELSGKVHAVLGTVLALMTALHIVAALVHHYVFKDDTLKIMLLTKKHPD